MDLVADYPKGSFTSAQYSSPVSVLNALAQSLGITIMFSFIEQGKELSKEKFILTIGQIRKIQLDDSGSG